MSIKNTDYTGNSVWIDRNEIKLYLNDIKGYTPISREEEMKLVKRIQAGDETAREALVLANLRFVITVAKHFQNLNVSLSDIISEGNYGLLKAAQKLDVKRVLETNNKFISYAVWWVHQSIYELINNHSRQIRVPVNVINKMIKGKSTLDGEQYEQLEYDLGVPIVNSLNIPINEDGEELGNLLVSDTFESPDEMVLNNHNIKDEILKAMVILNDREKDIVVRYFGLVDGNDETLEMIAESMNLTKERVRQIKEGAIRKLRHNPNALFPFYD